MSKTKPVHKVPQGKKRQGKRKKSGGVWRWVLLVAFVILCIFGFWYCRTAKMYRPVPSGARIDGIDVSHFQGEVNWHEVAQVEDVHFVIIKATEGASWRDKFFHENVWQAREEGLHVGAYLLYTANSTPEEQFQNFLDYTKDAETDLIPCIDVEEDVDRKNLKQNVLQLIDLMEAHYGRKPLLYVNAHVYNDYFHPEAAGCELWIPNYSRKPVLKGDERPFVWQFSETGRLPGIDEYVDLDCLVNGMTIDRLIMR